MKKFLIVLGGAAVLAVAAYFIFYCQTDTGFANEQLDIMNKAKTEYESKKGSQAADEAIQEMNQALFEVREKCESIKAESGEEAAEEFKAKVGPTYNELKAIVEDYLEEELEEL